MENYSSKLIEQAVQEFTKLPGIGRRTALRLVLYLLKQNVLDVETFGNTIIKMRQNIVYCKKCFNISDTEICLICSNIKRDHTTICVVADIRDVMAIEHTSQYNGIYHVLGGVISPMDGIGPQNLNIEPLLRRVKEENIKEVIFAITTTMEGEMTNFYLHKKLSAINKNIKITTIAKGVAIGDELEYADEITLGQSIIHRVPYVSGRTV